MSIIFTKPTGKSLPDYVIQAGFTDSSRRHKTKKACLLSGRLATITSPPFGGNSFCFIAGVKIGLKK